MTANTYGRQLVIPLTNKSGGSVAAGDVVVVDTTNNDAFTTTTSAGFTGGVGIAQETIANNATGRVLIGGYAALVNVNASVTRGQYGATHTVAKQAAGQASRGAGTFCQFLTGGTTPDALVYPVDLLGSSLTDPMTTRGDIIYRDPSNVLARLGRGSAGYVLTSDGTDIAWAAPAGGTHHGGLFTGATSCSNNADQFQTMTNADTKDTDNFHFTSDANLTGTVSKTSGSPNITGSGTSFTTELSVNQVITIPGTATEIGTVKTITDNTHIVLWQNMANTASGQTATRRSGFVAIPVGLAGVYNFTGYFTFPQNANGDRWGGFIKNSFAGAGRSAYHRASANWTFGAAIVSPEMDMAEGEVMAVACGQDSGGSLSCTLTFGMTKVG